MRNKIFKGNLLENVVHHQDCLHFHSFRRQNHISWHQFQFLYHKTQISNSSAEFQQESLNSCFYVY